MLKKIIITLVTLISISNIALAANNYIATLDVDKVRVETKAGKSIIKQLESLQNKLNDKIAKLQKDFDNQKADLDKQKMILSKEAFAKKEAAFAKKLNDSRKIIQTEASEIEKVQQEALNEFNITANNIINDIAKESSYQQILPIGLLIYADPKTDITSQVIAAIDKKSDHIAVKTPAAVK